MIKPRVLFSGDWINEENISKLLLSGRINQKLADLLPNLSSVLQVFYPDRWDIQFSALDGIYSPLSRIFKPYSEKRRIPKIEYVVQIVIFFPKLIISNTEEEHHTMENLYGKITLRSQRGSIYIEGLHALRLSTTLEEHKGLYLYSHIPSGTIEKLEWGKCCLGESELVDTIEKYNLGNDIPFLKMLLLQLEGYFQWESIEGVPHRRMKKVGGRKELENRNELWSHETKLVRNLISQIPSLTTAKLNLRVVNNFLTITDDIQYDLFLMELAKLNYSIPVIDINFVKGEYKRDQTFCLKDEDGNYCHISTLSKTKDVYLSPDKNTFVLFKGERKYAFVQPSTKEETQEKFIFTLNPIIKAYAKSRLEYAFNKERIKSDALKILHSC